MECLAAEAFHAVVIRLCSLFGLNDTVYYLLWLQDIEPGNMEMYTCIPHDLDVTPIFLWHGVYGKYVCMYHCMYVCNVCLYVSWYIDNSVTALWNESESLYVEY